MYKFADEDIMDRHSSGVYIQCRVFDRAFHISLKLIREGTDGGTIKCFANHITESMKGTKLSCKPRLSAYGCGHPSGTGTEASGQIF